MHKVDAERQKEPKRASRDAMNAIAKGYNVRGRPMPG